MLTQRRGGCWNSGSFFPKLIPRRKIGALLHVDLAKKGEIRRVLRRGNQKEKRAEEAKRRRDMQG